jgi:hypothetical protein
MSYSSLDRNNLGIIGSVTVFVTAPGHFELLTVKWFENIYLFLAWIEVKFSSPVAIFRLMSALATSMTHFFLLVRRTYMLEDVHI